MRSSALGLLALASCGYTDVELSQCFPDCGGSSNSSDAGDGGGGGEEDLGLTLVTDWATPNSLAIRWPTTTLPEAVTGYTLSIGPITWSATQDPRLGARATDHTVVSELTPDTAYEAVLRGVRSGDSLIVARGSLRTQADVTRAATIFDEGESPARTGFMNQAPPSTHQGTDALWFAADTLGAGDAPGLNGLSLADEGLANAAQTAFLEVWIRVDSSGAGLSPFSTRLTAGASSYNYDLLVPPGVGWHRVQVPTIAHRDEGNGALDLDQRTVTAWSIDAEWPAGSTIVVDDIRLRY